MRTHQASQSAALAVGLVAALGFLGYTMLGPRSAEAPLPLPLRAAPTAAAKPPPHRQATPPAPTPAAPLTPDVIGSAASRALPPAPVAAVLQVAPAQVAVAPEARATAATVTVVVPPPPVALPVPVAPPPAPVVHVRPAPVVKQAQRPVVPRAKQVAASREVRTVHAQAEPVESPVVPRAKQVAASREVRTAHAQAEPVGSPMMAAHDTPARKPARGSASAPFSKEEMTVTISGDKAWVQVSPTQTLAARKGDVLPNLGKILEIKDKEVVAEKGTLTIN